MPDNRSERAQRNVFPAKPLISRIKDAAGQRRQPVWKGKGRNLLALLQAIGIEILVPTNQRSLPEGHTSDAVDFDRIPRKPVAQNRLRCCWWELCNILHASRSSESLVGWAVCWEN